MNQIGLDDSVQTGIPGKDYITTAKHNLINR